MANESELAKKITQAVRSIDKLVQDIRRDTQRCFEVLKELKEMRGDDSDKTQTDD